MSVTIHITPAILQKNVLGGKTTYHSKNHHSIAQNNQQHHNNRLCVSTIATSERPNSHYATHSHARVSNSYAYYVLIQTTGGRAGGRAGGMKEGKARHSRWKTRTSTGGWQQRPRAVLPLIFIPHYTMRTPARVERYYNISIQTGRRNDSRGTQPLRNALLL